MSEHVRDQAAGLAALPETDPERIQAYEHARTCPDCAEALAQGARLMAMLDAAPALEAPSAATLARTLAMIAEETEPVRAPARVRARPGPSPLLALAAIVVSALFAYVDAQGGGLAVRVGVECLGIELIVGALPVAFLGRKMMTGSLPPPVPTFAAIAGWSALGAQAYLHFRCPVAHDGPHLAAFHVGGVVLATLIAVVVGTRLNATAAAS